MGEAIVTYNTGFEDAKKTGTFFFGLPPKMAHDTSQNGHQPNDAVEDEENHQFEVTTVAAASQKKRNEVISKASAYWTSSNTQGPHSTGARKKKMPVISMKLMRLLDKASQDGATTQATYGLSTPGDSAAQYDATEGKKTGIVASSDEYKKHRGLGIRIDGSIDGHRDPGLSIHIPLEVVNEEDGQSAYLEGVERVPQRRKAMSEGGRRLESRAGATKLAPINTEGLEPSFGFLKEIVALGRKGPIGTPGSRPRPQLECIHHEKLSGLAELSTEFSTNEPIVLSLPRPQVPRSAGIPSSHKLFEMPPPSSKQSGQQSRQLHTADLTGHGVSSGENPYTIPFSKVDSYNVLPKAYDWDYSHMQAVDKSKIGISYSLPPSIVSTPVSCAPSLNGVDFVKAMRNNPRISQVGSKPVQSRGPKVSFAENFFVIGSSGQKRVFFDMKTDNPPSKNLPSNGADNSYQQRLQASMQHGSTEISNQSMGIYSNHYHRLIKPLAYKSPSHKLRLGTDSSQFDNSQDTTSFNLVPDTTSHGGQQGLPKLSAVGLVLRKSGSRRTNLPVTHTVHSGKKDAAEQPANSKLKQFFKDEQRPNDICQAEEALNRSIHSKMDLLHLKYKEKVAQLGARRRPKKEREDECGELARLDAPTSGDGDVAVHIRCTAGEGYLQPAHGSYSNTSSKPKFSLGRGYHAGAGK